MDPIASITSAGAKAAPAVQAAQAAQTQTAAPTTGTAKTPAQVAADRTAAAQEAVRQLGLPPAGLATAASINTLNAALAVAGFGVDPATVSGAYGGAGGAGNMFSGTSMLPLLSSLTSGNAAQALALLGIQTPSPAGSALAAAAAPAPTAAGSTPVTTSQALAPAGKSALDQAVSTASGPAIVDPLWGKAS